METDEKTDQKLALQKYGSFIAAQLNTRNDPSIIIQKLEGMGVDQGEASQLVQIVQAQIGTQPCPAGQPLVSSTLPMSILGGVLAAIIGGFIWGMIVKVTNFEIGFMAIGIGALCGYGVRILSGGEGSKQEQIIAVISSLIGILIGKYATFCFVMKDFMLQKNPEMAANISIFLPKVFFIFMAFGLRATLGVLDILFVFLAIRAALRITAA